MALAPYVAGVLCAATLVALELAIAGSCIFLLFLLWGFVSMLMDKINGRPDDAKAHASPLDRIRGTRIVKTGLFGDSSTGFRVDEAGRVMKEGGIFDDDPTGVRVREDGRIVNESIFGDSPTGLKLDPEGRLVEEGFFGDDCTGKKIDAEGRIVDQSIFGDSQTGVKFKKD